MPDELEPQTEVSDVDDVGPIGRDVFEELPVASEDMAEDYQEMEEHFQTSIAAPMTPELFPHDAAYIPSPHSPECSPQHDATYSPSI